MNNICYNQLISALLCSAALTSPAFAQTSVGQPAGDPGKPNPLKNVYFGEQHMHTQNSFDAWTVGVRGTWAEAYEFALGMPSKLSTTGEPMQRRTPYDFVAITDHSEYYGVFKNMADPDSPLSKNPLALSLASSNPAEVQATTVKIIATVTDGNAIEAFMDPDLLKSNWEKFIETADKYNDPGKFTALYAYEWTSIPNGKNMHRNVFFKDKPAALPFSSFESVQPEDLWTYLEIQRAQGIDTFAIPHNGNVSDGLMYAPTKMNGDPIDERYARRQMENEPLTEIHQTKGNSESHPLLSPNDEFAGFEPFDNLISTNHPSQVTNGFIRQGLVTGMQVESMVGYNPFKMGIVAGADVHSGYQGNEEWDWKGAHGTADDTPQKRLSPTPNASGEAGYIVSSAGATAVWATENTREGIFNAMKSKETYGTTGTLIRLRFFGGWDFSSGLVEDVDFVKKAYATGVPMGQDMPAHPLKDMAQSPSFAVWALKDPNSGNLDRIQIIKGWTSPVTGYPEEAIYDVAWSDTAKRQPDPDTGKLPPVGNSVNVKTATYTNEIGDSQLSVVWTDPDFDPTMKAVYYVRVLEIPTPRWSTYDAVKLGIEPVSEVPATIQERAYSSPIWYTPSKEVMEMAKSE
ncbi:MAG: DUF3604 domain-containing protein [Paracoccaceae bacterium]